MQSLVSQLRIDFPSLTFAAGDRSCWSFIDQTIVYESDDSQSSLFGLLHELGHALLKHRNYCTDVGLLRREAAAWDEAKRVATHYGIVVDAEHIEDCLDTYRDWLHRRSACPICKNHGLQADFHTYECVNCHATWRVSAQRSCRPYRKRQK